MSFQFKAVHVNEAPEDSRLVVRSGEDCFVYLELRDAVHKTRELLRTPVGVASTRIVLEHCHAGEWLPVAHFILAKTEQ